LKAAALALFLFFIYLFELNADVACNPWLLVGVCIYSHCGDDVVNALIDEADDCGANAIG
jgi:hypothetical protein